MSGRPNAAAPAGRVLIIVQNLPVPFDRRVWLEATTLANAGYSVSVICPKLKGFNASHETLENVDIYRYALPIAAQGVLGFVVEFTWCLAATTWLTANVALFGRGFDVVQACNPPETFWPLGLLCRAFGKVFMFDHHDLSPEMFAVKFDRKGGFLLQALLFLERMTFRAAQVVLTTNQSHKKVALTRGHCREQDVYVVRSGPDLTRFTPYARSDAWHHGKRHLIAYLGEICKQDGVDHLVRAMKILRDDHGRSDVHCVLMGGGPHQPVIARYAEQLGLTDCCTFMGHVSDETLCRVLSSADIGVDPDPKNPWSDCSTMNKIVEYMFFGLPVVAYGLHETRVSAGEAGLYAAANSEEGLARCIAHLLDDAEERRRMGNIARQRVHDELGWHRSVPHLLEAYRHAFELRMRTRGRGSFAVSPRP
jgi:glycosyltransferase involved in cell wall biosynthesis